MRRKINLLGEVNLRREWDGEFGGAWQGIATVKSIILCKSLNVVISSGHHAHYTCKNVRALFSQFSWKSINIEPIKRSAEAMFG